jgi:hypothetical protein
MRASVIAIVISTTSLLWSSVTLGSPALIEHLAEAGLEEVQIEEDEDAKDSITLALKHGVKEIDEQELRKSLLAAMIAIHKVEGEVKRAAIKIQFADGQVMQVAGNPAEFRAEMDEVSFLRTARVRFLSRGPAATPGPCIPARRMSCKRNPQRCPCEPGHRCEPEDKTADSRGCLLVLASTNAEASGSTFVCKPGHTWDKDGYHCVPIPDCGESSLEHGGVCECPPGVEKNPSGGCGPAPAKGDGGAPDAGLSDGGASDASATADLGAAADQDTLFPRWVWLAMAVGVVLSAFFALVLFGSIIRSLRSRRSKIGLRKYCIHCGRKLEMEDTFCGKCKTEQP